VIFISCFLCLDSAPIGLDDKFRAGPLGGGLEIP
jgi:hypothetical protein